MCDSILETLLKIKDRTKDSVNARLEAKQLRSGIEVEDDDAQIKLTSVSYVLSKKRGKRSL